MFAGVACPDRQTWVILCARAAVGCQKAKKPVRQHWLLQNDIFIG